MVVVLSVNVSCKCALQWYKNLQGWLDLHRHLTNQRKQQIDSVMLSMLRCALQSLLRYSPALSCLDVQQHSDSFNWQPPDREVERLSLQPRGGVVGDKYFFGAAVLGHMLCLDHGLPLHKFDVGSAQLLWTATDKLQGVTLAADGEGGLASVAAAYQQGDVTVAERDSVVTSIREHLGDAACDLVSISG